MDFGKGDCNSSEKVGLEGIRLGAWNPGGTEMMKTSSKERMETSTDGTE